MPVAATVYASESNGAGEVVTNNISNLNFGGADLPNLVPGTHPIVRPNGGATAYSFKKEFRIRVAAMGDSALIQTLKWWKTAGAYVVGEVINATVTAALAYITPTQADVGPAMAVVEPAGANIAIAGSFTGSFIAPGYSDYTRAVLVINAGGVTPIGAVNQKTLIFQYDES